jgi:hypothetical protein
VHALLRRPAALAELLRELRDQSAGATPFVWWDEIEDRTRGTLDREAIRQRDDFTGMLAQYGDALLADPAARDAFASACTEGVILPADQTLPSTRSSQHME